MLSTVICHNGTPFSVWREFQTRTKHGISESIQNDFGASSKSSGSKSKEPKVALVSKEDDSVEKKPVPKAIALAAKKVVAAKKKRKKKAAKKPKKVTPGAKKADPSKKVESDHSNSMSSDSDLHPDEFPSKKPSVRPWGSGDLCYVCNGEHLAYYCPCWFSIPQNTHINDNYCRCCSKCGGVVDEFDFEEGVGFKCKRCSRRVRAYARYHPLRVSWK